MDPNQNILGLFTQISVLTGQREILGLFTQISVLTGQREQTRQTTMHLIASYSSHKECRQELGIGCSPVTSNDNIQVNCVSMKIISRKQVPFPSVPLYSGRCSKFFVFSIGGKVTDII